MDREVLYYKFIAGFFVFICASVFLLPEVSPQEKRERLAVAPFEVSGGISDSSVGSIVSDLILSRLSDKFEIYERTLLRKLIDERALQASDLAEARPNAVEAMRLVGVKMLVVGQVARLEGKVVVTARVVDCVSGKVLTKGDVSAESLDALPDRIDELLNKLRLKDGSLGGRGEVFVPDERGEVGRWVSLSVDGAPSARTQFSMIRCGDFVVVWGGSGERGLLNDGARFDIKERKWLPMSSHGAPSARAYHTAVWTGKHMIVWGGKGAQTYLNDGAKYDPVSDVWSSIRTPEFLKSRCLHAAVWTGKHMLVWGGKGESFYRDGALYEPETDTWKELPLEGVPPRERIDFAYGICGKYFVVWGGIDKDGNCLGTGSVLDTERMEWRRITEASAPAARSLSFFCETPKGLFIGGGETKEKSLSLEPALYDPVSDTWVLAKYDVSRARPFGLGVSATFCKGTVVIWGGIRGKDETSTLPRAFSSRGYAYSIESGEWYRLSQSGAPAARSGHRAVWCDKYLLIWGGWVEKEGGGGASSPAQEVIRLGNGGILEP